ncbi:MAG: N-acetylglucosamine-6-phosphate deacetylase [Thermoguttaceae bacterium]|jgi:N-acetylglucosamine-6-phosphate deacetylase|nr:N-acetylglucosamine-6-phosphate deacetylase [Thermoguttaceae bacterium]
MHATEGPIYIQNGEVVLPDRSIPGGTVVLADGRIVHAGKAKKTPRGAAEFDAASGYVTPGLIDLHIHGAGMVGWETCTAEGLAQFDANLLACGIVRFVPTMMADPAVIKRVAGLLDTESCSDRVPGLYVEGPFISPDKRGGVQPQYVRPVDLRYLRELQRLAGGRIRMMTFAPELDGAGALPAAMRKLGILPCVGHTMASAAEAAAVCGRQKICCTHLYNAMRGLDHREPGLAAFALNQDRVYVELNPDGTHVAPDLLRITHRAKPADRIILISDAVISAGAKPGIYQYMTRKVRSTAQGVYYAEEGTLIGSSVLLNEGVRRFVHFTGAPVHEAVRMASRNPANLLGLGRRTGSLEPGKSADVVVFTRDFGKARAVFWKGTAVHQG